jgi:hypothetical protein
MAHTLHCHLGGVLGIVLGNAFPVRGMLASGARGRQLIWLHFFGQSSLWPPTQSLQGIRPNFPHWSPSSNTS